MENAENKTPSRISGKKLGLIIGAVALVLALVIVGLTGGFGNEAKAGVPADGNPNDETCKGTYTASDRKVIAAADTVVATAGDFQLTNAQLQVYYWLDVQTFLNNYGYYASMLGFDYTQPFDTQMCSMGFNGTWQQFFLASALRSWQNYTALSAEAEAADFQMDAETRAYLDGLTESLETQALGYGYESAKDMLAHTVGQGAEIEDYIHFMETYNMGYLYYNALVEEIAPTPEQVEQYFRDNEAAYLESGIKEEDTYVDVRHILVTAKGGTKDESGITTYSEEEWAECEAAAQAILDEWLAGDKTEDSFAALAGEKTEDPGSKATGGLYEDVYVGQMVKPFEEWCFDESRQPGDTGLVKTDYGWHVMYFVDSTPVWQIYAESDYIAEQSNLLVEEVAAKYPLTVDYASILLGEVDMSGDAEVSYWGELDENGINVLLIAGISACVLAAAAILLRKKEEME